MSHGNRNNLSKKKEITPAEREYKRIPIQIDALESNVRLEGKQTFTELQTDMIELTAELGSFGIPTLDQVTVPWRYYFPGL